MNELRKLPGIDKILNTTEIQNLVQKYNRDLLIYIARTELEHWRFHSSNGNSIPEFEILIQRIVEQTLRFSQKKLKPVINATGIINHTNIGRAPLGESLIEESLNVIKGYNNLEFDLAQAKRGSRYEHVSELLKYLTGAEDVLVVNNNAAAVMLILRAFARNKEVIISRGELIEIGGAFRMPDIMAASDCIMKEVGTTNKTKLSDYQNAITSQTAMLFKAHQSNYSIEGFTAAPSLEQLVALGKKHNLPVVYDMGSGLLKKSTISVFQNEPDVEQALKEGIDLITFSGDKLLGGPQAGIIAGKADMIALLKKEPLTRALRVCKLTLALLETLCLKYLDNSYTEIPIYRMLLQSNDVLYAKALKLQELFKANSFDSSIIENDAFSGGGALPNERIKSFAVKLNFAEQRANQKSKIAETLYHELLLNDCPVLGILRKGDLLFDVLTTDEQQITKIAELVHQTFKRSIYG